MNEQEFKDGDLMPWQDMTRAIKNLQVFNDEHTERLQQLEDILKSYFSEFPSKRIFELEKEVGRMSSFRYDLNEQFKLITSCLEKIKELETRVDSLTRTLDFLQEVTGIEVVVIPGDDSLDQRMKEWSLSMELKQQESTHMGECELCDRVAPLNSGNICQGCFLEELDNDKYLAL